MLESDRCAAELSGQYAAVDEQLTGYENLEMIGRILSGFAADAVHAEGRAMRVAVSGAAQTLTHALRALDAAGIGLRDVGLRRPTLDDVFLSLTGQPTNAQDEAKDPTTDRQLMEVA